MATAAPRISRDDFQRAAVLATGWRRPVLLSHTRPDGDAIGALLALRAMLRTDGRTPRALLYEPPPARYAWLLKGDPLEVLPNPVDVLYSPLAEADGVVIADTCAYSQLEPVEAWLRAAGLPVLAIDHHVTRDVPAGARLIDEAASATCLILLEWSQAMGWALDGRARKALFTGIATDTGWFRFSNTDARTHEAAAELVRQGTDPAAVYEEIYQRESAARLRLLGAALDTVELHGAGRLAVMTVTRAMLARTGAESGDTEDLVNYPLQIDRVDVSVLLVEHDDGLVRTSFRSKPPNGSRPDVDVAAVAADFGGGGHRRAAGARIRGTMHEVKRRVVQRLA